MPVKPIIPLLPLRVCSGPSTEATTSGSGPVALEAEQGVVEDREMLARVLEVDRDELRGDLEVHQREPGGTTGLTSR